MNALLLNAEAFTALRPAHHLVGHDRQHPRPGRPRPRLAALHLDLARPVPLRPHPLRRLRLRATSPAASASSSSSWSSPLWGWRQWNRGRQQAAGRLHRRPLRHLARARRAARRRRRRHRSPSAPLFTAYPPLSWNPWPDAYIFVGTIVAMYAQARGMVEFWFAWLLVDLVGVPLTFANGWPSPASSTSSTARSSCGACATGGCAPARPPQPALEGAPA